MVQYKWDKTAVLCFFSYTACTVMFYSSHVVYSKHEDEIKIQILIISAVKRSEVMVLPCQADAGVAECGGGVEILSSRGQRQVHAVGIGHAGRFNT